jgi:hypothetical protein
MGSSLERGSRFKVLGSKVQGFRVQRLNSEPQNRRIMNRRISKGGFALLNLFYKIDRSTQRLSTGRIYSFDIRNSIFIIRPARNAFKPV